MMSDGSGGVPELFFSKLFQHFSDISVNADGLPLDFFRGEGFAEVDAGVAGIGPAAGHVPEGVFDDAGGVMFIAHHFFGDHLRLMFWQHSGLHK